MEEYLEKQADNSYKLVCGVGVNDLPNLTRINGKQGKDYQLWRDMLRRSFSDVSDFARSAYKDVTCCDEWLIFSSFINDIREKSGYGNDGWHLDKDILIKGNKIYSRDTVCFVPKEINNLLTKNNKNRGGLPIGVYFQKERSSFASMISINGKQKRLGCYKNPIDAFNAYKREKERFIKIKAEEYKDTLDPIVFDALIKYEVDIND